MLSAVLLATACAAAPSDLECGYKKLAYAQALKMQPWADHKAVYEAMSLQECGVKFTLIHYTQTLPGTGADVLVNGGDSFYVCGAAGDDMRGDGSEASPFRTVHRAVAASRAARTLSSSSKPKNIILKKGNHYLGLNGTITLGPADSGLSITSAADADGDAWLSGGVQLSGLKWKKSDAAPNAWSASLKGYGVNAVKGLFTTDGETRYVRARWPNANPEHACWGYSCSEKDVWALNSDNVALWHKPQFAGVPAPKTVNFTTTNPSGEIKKDSQMAEYNTWTVGSGGACATTWKGESYWCSNASAGGWAEVDFQAAQAGTLQLPVGMSVNFSSNNRGHNLDRMKSWSNPDGAVVAAWHSQTWFLNFFTVAGAKSNPSKGILEFEKGGSQGGRNWCRCDQCHYAAGIWANGNNWCDGPKDDRLIGGSWIVENVFEELDAPGEFFYNVTTETLFVIPNATAGGVGGRAASPPTELVVPVLDTLVSIVGTQAAPVKNVTIANVNFRDGSAVYEEQWEVPSGGDWAFHRSAAVQVSGSEGVVLAEGKYRRLDGNAVLLTGYNRDASIDKNEFTFIGQNAIAGWGDTDGWDGRAGNQPQNTKVTNNLVREIGFFEKQSSAWFQAKTAKTTLENNIFFNMPRAAINFNDGFGGGNVVVNNLIFNTCKESGDHGPINSWDRQTYATSLGKDGATILDPLPTLIAANFIFANNGAAQAVDNDDGSSFYAIEDNVFYDADGFKMDYGGHGSTFHNNMVVGKLGGGSQCFDLGPFLPGLGDSYCNNTCVFPGNSGKGSLGFVPCDKTEVTMHDNKYYLDTYENASIGCSGTDVPLADLFEQDGIEENSKAFPMPSDEELVAWAKARLW